MKPLYAGISQIVLKEKTSQAVIARMKARDTLAETNGVGPPRRCASRPGRPADKITTFRVAAGPEIEQVKAGQRYLRR